MVDVEMRMEVRVRGGEEVGGEDGDGGTCSGEGTLRMATEM